MHSGNSQSKQSLQAEQAHPVQQAVTAAQAQQPFKQSIPQSLQQSSGNLQQFSHFGTSHLQQSAEHSGSSHLQHSAHFGISHVQHSGAEQHSGAHSGLHSGIFKQSPLQQSEVHSGKEQVQQSPHFAGIPSQHSPTTSPVFRRIQGVLISDMVYFNRLCQLVGQLESNFLLMCVCPGICEIDEWNLGKQLRGQLRFFRFFSSFSSFYTFAFIRSKYKIRNFTYTFEP